MSESTARHSLPFIQPAQAQKHVTHNEALEQLDLRVQLTVEAFDATTPPTSRNDGQIWALGPVPSGEWAGQGDRLAAWTNGAWVFLSPRIGWRAARGTELRIWTGNDWHAPDLPMLQDLHGVGIQTSFDTTNRLAVASEATLLTHAGADHQLKINKNEATDTASLLFQTGWSGRAEMGTAGSDTWSIKVSADGVDWRDALRADPATGQITIPEGMSVSGTISLPENSLDLTSDPAFTGQLPLTHGGTGATTAAGARMALGLGDAATAQVTASATDTTAGRLIATQAGPAQAFRRGNILGTVSQSGGEPTGAIIQRGSNANGHFVRFADGTQICWHRINLGSVTAQGTGTLANPYRTAGPNWTYPAEYAGGMSPEVQLSAEYVGALIDVRRAYTMSKGARNRFTQFNIQAWRWSTVDDPDEVIAVLTAFGRWF